MHIVDVATFRADGGWRPFSFLKISTDEGLVGWSEFVESSWSPGLRNTIIELGEAVAGEDPTRFAALAARLHAVTRFASGGINHQAIAAIENACLDIAAKSYGIPVCKMFGGAFRDRIDVYWSHCGTFRVAHPALFEKILGKSSVKTLHDMRRLGEEAVERGYGAVKTNPIMFGSKGPRVINPGFLAEGLKLGSSADESTIHGIQQQLTALREGVGPETSLMLDCNFAFRGESLRRIAGAIAGAKPAWLEADLDDPRELAQIRSRSSVPIASLESMYGRRGYIPYLKAAAVDLAIVDVIWNGLPEAVRIAETAESFEVNVAPHNFYGPLADLMSAQFCAAVSNVPIMEFEADDVPWKRDLLTHPFAIDDGRISIPDRPGWGADIDESMLKARPWTH